MWNGVPESVYRGVECSMPRTVPYGVPSPGVEHESERVSLGRRIKAGFVREHFRWAVRLLILVS